MYKRQNKNRILLDITILFYVTVHDWIFPNTGQLRNMVYSLHLAPFFCLFLIVFLLFLIVFMVLVYRLLRLSKYFKYNEVSCMGLWNGCCWPFYLYVHIWENYQKTGKMIKKKLIKMCSSLIKRILSFFEKSGPTNGLNTVRI